jgi:hypothetical protein
MGQYSVPCWCCSVKNVPVFASGSTPVRFPVLVPGSDSTLPVHPHHDLTRSPRSLTTTPVVSVHIDHPLLGQNVCRNGLTSLKLLTLRPFIHALKGMHTFGGRCARFRGADTRFLGQIQVHSTLKTVLRPSLTVRKPSHGISAHFRGTGCELSGKVNLPTWWESCAQVSVDSRSCRQHPVRLCKAEYDVGTWRFLRDPVAEMTRHEGEALNGIER